MYVVNVAYASACNDNTGAFSFAEMSVHRVIYPFWHEKLWAMQLWSNKQVWIGKKKWYPIGRKNWHRQVISSDWLTIVTNNRPQET